jgi:laminin, alpha 1/2
MDFHRAAANVSLYKVMLLTCADKFLFSECSICDSSAKICDQETGRCVCPPLSHGSECQLCHPNTWGWEFLKGCKNCECNQMGSMKQSCDVKTGQCNCKEGYTGRACDYCAIGYFGYPNCQKCNCDVSGSKNLPGYDVIDCDDRGQCPCKELTTGLKCNECRQSTFGLSPHNPSGCTRCFCFGRSQECSQNPLIWGQIRLMGPRNVTIRYIRDYQDERNDEDVHHVIVTHIRNNQLHRESGELSTHNGLTVFPSYSGNVTIGSRRAFYHPFYFQLPKEFLGDKTSSYGGFLNYSIIADGCRSNLDEETLSQFPLVQMHTHFQLILDYFPPEMFNSSVLSQSYNIVLHESFWRYHSNGYNISRAIMMTALQTKFN